MSNGKANPLLAAAAFAALALAAGPAQSIDDYYIEQYNSHTGSDSSASPSEGSVRMWISEGAIRIEDPDGQFVHITDLRSARLITLDLHNREYFAIGLDQVRSDLARASERLRQRMQLSWSVERNAGNDSVSGFDCRLIRFHGRGRVESGEGRSSPLRITVEFWVADDPELPQEIFFRLMEAIGFSSNPFVDERVLEELRYLGGFPIRTRTTVSMDSISDSMEQTVLNVRRRQHLEDRYRIPEGYTETETPPMEQR